VTRWPTWRAAVVAATGPSLTQDDLQRCHVAGLPVVAVNNAYRLAPWAAMLYACDGEWWEHYRPWELYTGRKLTQDHKAARRFGLEHIPALARPGFSTNPETIHQGGNSGFQALNIALHCAERVLLLGFDMQLIDGRRHYFGDHPGRLHKTSPYRRWLAAFDAAAPAVAGRVVNCTPDSALRAFPQLPLAEALCSFAG
jgi:hypothetical protein